MQQAHIMRRNGLKLASCIILALVLGFGLLLAGCTSGADGGSSGLDTSANPGRGSSTDQDTAGSGKVIRIGTLPTEDTLPFWVAEQDGIFKANGLDVQVITFQSADELAMAVTTKEVDLAMTDVMRTANLVASGTSVNILWVTLGQTPEQGRFGILVNPKSNIKSVSDLAGKKIAVGSNTVPEYAMDRILQTAGLSKNQIATEEIANVATRYQMVASNQVPAAALPASLLYFGEQNGLVVIADDTKGENISQSVMIVRSDFVAETDIAIMQALETSWNQAVDKLNADPNSYRSLLVEKAQLPDTIADSYPISDYPKASLPSSQMVNDVINWMLDKGYLKVTVNYDESTGMLSL